MLHTIDSLGGSPGEPRGPRPGRIARRAGLVAALLVAFAPLTAAADDAAELAEAYEGLYELLDGRDLEVRPRRGEDTAAQLEARYGPGLTVVLREAGQRLDAELHTLRARARALVPGAADASARERLFAEEDALDALRTDALALIAIYERPQQKTVDKNRKAVEKAYADYAELVEERFAVLEELAEGEAWTMVERLRRGDAVLELVDEVLDDRDEAELDRLEDEPDTLGGESGEALFSEHETYAQASNDFDDAPKNLEEFPWLVLLFAADQHVEVLRSTDLMTRRIDIEPTRLERWLLRELRARSVEAFTSAAVHSSTEDEYEFTPILNAYRRGLGLELLTIDERLVMASRQHSQHQVDNGYFAHEAPDPRRRTPWDRARLEDYEGQIAENIAQGRHDARSVFEAWYRSPGHHRNMVARHAELGCAADSSGSIWTLVLGRGDSDWRDWHRDPATPQRAEHGTMVSRAAKSLAKGSMKDKTWKNDVLPVLDVFVDELVAGIVATGSESDDSAWRHAIASWDRIVGARTGIVVLESTGIMQVLDYAADSEDTGLRRAAETFLRTHVPELGTSLDALDAREATWEQVRRDWEDRARVRFKAGRGRAS